MFHLQLDSDPEIGTVSQTPLQALVLQEDSTAVSRFPLPKETTTLERGCVIHLLIRLIFIFYMFFTWIVFIVK